MHEMTVIVAETKNVVKGKKDKICIKNLYMAVYSDHLLLDLVYGHCSLSPWISNCVMQISSGRARLIWNDSTAQFMIWLAIEPVDMTRQPFIKLLLISRQNIQDTLTMTENALLLV